VIDSYTIDDSTITDGETTWLRWEFHNATESHLYRDAVEIDSGLSSAGDRPVNPHVTRTFKLVVSNAVGSAEASVTLTVNPAGPPVIEFFTASPGTITTGDSSTLEWGSVTNATSVTIDQGIGGVGTPGSTVVSPGSTTTYTMEAVGPGGTTTASVTVTVNPPAPTQVTVRVRFTEVYWEDVPIAEKCSAVSGGPGWCRMFLRIYVNGLPMKEIPGAYPTSSFHVHADGETSFFNWETDPFLMMSDQSLEIMVDAVVNRFYYGAPGPYATFLMDRATVTYDPVTAGEGDHQLWGNGDWGWRFRINLVRVTID
jgi:hypothetical protein